MTLLMAAIPQSRLHELFAFDADAGLLIWRVRPVYDFATVGAWKIFNAHYAGKVAGCVNPLGYRQIQVDGKRWPAHRLIWIYVNGAIADGLQIDHTNGNRSDNRLENLREVTRAENGQNRAISSNNTSGVVGVQWSPRNSKWRAKITVAKRGISLGLFDTLEAAAAARAAAERKFGFHPNHGRKSVAEARK